MAKEKNLKVVLDANVKPRKATGNIDKEWLFFGFRLRFTCRPSGNTFMGRFGGGWNWKVGLQAGGNTLLINLIIASLRIDKIKKVGQGNARNDN